MNVLPRERLVDATDLEAPEPLLLAMAELDELQAGQYLRLLLWHEPLPLYALLDEAGFRYFGRPGNVSAYEVFIWRRGDKAAEQALNNVIDD